MTTEQLAALQVILTAAAAIYAVWAGIRTKQIELAARDIEAKREREEREKAAERERKTKEAAAERDQLRLDYDRVCKENDQLRKRLDACELAIRHNTLLIAQVVKLGFTPVDSSLVSGL